MMAGGTGLTELTQATSLPQGCRVQPLKVFDDARGDYAEIFRNMWFDAPAPLQWGASRSAANVLRGVHVHAKHWDYVVMLAGRMHLALHDMRADSPTTGRSVMVELDAAKPAMVSIPPGVAHGFYFPVASLNLTGASRYYDPPDHMRCRWDCPELGLAWPCAAPLLSPQDEAAGGYGALAQQFSIALAAARSASR
jgi:dTDP-4-dehydrorhamnose 3,5-epimerase